MVWQSRTNTRGLLPVAGDYSELLVEVTAGGESTQITYYETSTAANYMKKRKEVRPDGSWTYYSYYTETDAGTDYLIERAYSPFMSTPVASTFTDSSTYEGASAVAFSGTICRAWISPPRCGAITFHILRKTACVDKDDCQWSTGGMERTFNSACLGIS